MAYGGTPDIKYTMDEISDDLFDLVLNWRKNVRRRITMKKCKPKQTHAEWVQDFVDYVVSREMVSLPTDAEKLRIAEAFVQFAKDLVPIGHGLLAKEAEQRIAKAKKESRARRGR